jgi:hypothetical protein
MRSMEQVTRKREEAAMHAHSSRGMLAVAAVLIAAFALSVSSAPAEAAAPDHETFNFSFDYTDTDTCGFPVAVHGEFTNMIIDSSLATGTGTLQLHQRDVETWTANGVTLHVNGAYTIFVRIIDGVPQIAKHVGVLDFIMGPNGDHLFFRTGEAVYQVVYDPVLGFYVDGPLITRHGVRDNFDAAKICGAFG